jgi:hypothetical protein
MAALILNIDMSASSHAFGGANIAAAAMLYRTADRRVLQEKERLRMAAALSSATKGNAAAAASAAAMSGRNVTPGRATASTSASAAFGSQSKSYASTSHTTTTTTTSRVKGNTPDINFIVGVSDMRSRKAAIHAPAPEGAGAGAADASRQRLLSAVSNNALHVLRLASLLDSTAELRL